MHLRTFCTIFILILSYSATAQKQYNIWAFGEKGGLNFNTSPVSAFSSLADAQLKQLPYYVSSICDKDGNLMFYTDGSNFWNKQSVKLPKHNNWWIWSANIMPLICPYPGNDSLFYVFGVGDGINPYDFSYITTMMHKSGDVEEVVWPQPVDP